VEQFDESFEFVIVGSGGGSMCAALVMRALGKSVLILEKTDLFGGTTARSGGVMWIPNNRFMLEAGVEDSFEKAMTYLDHTVGNHDDCPGASRARRAAYVTQGPQMLDFLVAQGIKFGRVSYWPDYFDERPGGSKEGRTVVADIFDVNQLGNWKSKLRPNFMQVPAPLEIGMKVSRFKTNWASKKAIVNVALRIFKQKITGTAIVTAGAALQGRMLQAAIKAQVELRNHAKVNELIASSDGAIVGVVVEIDGKTRRIGARSGVLVNAGGFSRNQAMRDIYQPGTSVEWTNTAPGDTGEMIGEMIRHGAAIAQMEEMVGCQITLTPDGAEIHPMIQGEVSSPHSMIVDQTGVRYLREAGSYMKYCQDVFERNKIAPAIPSWLVFDSQFMKKYMVAGTMPGTKKPQEWYDSGFLKQADTIEGLATACGMSAKNLLASIERFNSFARTGIDEDFHRGARAYDRFLGDPAHKPSESMGPVEQGPFYAYQVYPGDVGTFGGVVTDTDARVLRANGSVIPGLYATGISTASVMGRCYPGAGSSVGPSFVWGFVAAKHAGNASNIPV
jgi:3-oxosteroid 1-dehydrogenase